MDLKPLEDYINNTRFSPIADEFPDDTLYPEFKNATKLDITISPGERILIPAGWFHIVFSNEGFNLAHSQNIHTKWLPGDPENSLPYKEKYENNYSLDYLLTVTSPMECMYSDNNVISSNFITKTPSQDIKFKDFYELKDSRQYLYTQFENKDMLWANWGNVRTTLHYDRNDSLLHQIYGTKRLLLFAPNQHKKMYVYNTVEPWIIRFLETSLYKQIHVHKDSNIQYDNIKIDKILQKEPTYDLSSPVTCFKTLKKCIVNIGNLIEGVCEPGLLFIFPSTCLLPWFVSEPIIIYKGVTQQFSILNNNGR